MGQADDGAPVDWMAVAPLPAQLGQARGDGDVGIVGGAGCHHAEQKEPGLPLSVALAAIVRSGVAGPEFRYGFARPLDEPLLWLPDTLAGLAGAVQAAGPETRGAAGPWTRTLYGEMAPEQIVLPPLPGQA